MLLELYAGPRDIKSLTKHLKRSSTDVFVTSKKLEAKKMVEEVTSDKGTVLKLTREGRKLARAYRG